MAKHTYTFDGFEIELPVEGEDELDYYNIDLEVVADVTCVPGTLPTQYQSATPNIRSITILSYRVTPEAGEARKLAAVLDKRLHEHPEFSLGALHEMVWEEFLMEQESDEI